MHDGRLYTAIPQDVADTISGGYFASNVRNNDTRYGTLASLRHMARRLAHHRRQCGVAGTDKRNTSPEDSPRLKLLGGIIAISKIDLTERIRQRAYEIWESEARPHGRALVHWLRAELEIGEVSKSRKSAKRPAKPSVTTGPKSTASSGSQVRSPKKQSPKK